MRPFFVSIISLIPPIWSISAATVSITSLSLNTRAVCGFYLHDYLIVLMRPWMSCVTGKSGYTV